MKSLGDTHHGEGRLRFDAGALVARAAGTREPASYARELVRFLLDAAGADVCVLEVEGMWPEGVFHHLETRSRDGMPSDQARDRLREAERGDRPEALLHRFDHGHASGVLYLEPVAREERDPLATTAEIGILLLDLVAELAIARDEAARDPLTGLPNRRSVDEAVERTVAIGNRYPSRTFSIVMIDLDNFKWFNDTHGHPAGDDLLREMADALLHSIRRSDLAARWGGDEFLLLLPQTSPEAATVLLDRVTSGMERFTQRFEDDDIRLGFSAGVAYFPEDGRDATTLVEVADRRLYNAKPTPRS